MTPEIDCIQELLEHNEGFDDMQGRTPVEHPTWETFKGELEPFDYLDYHRNHVLELGGDASNITKDDLIECTECNAHYEKQVGYDTSEPEGGDVYAGAVLGRSAQQQSGQGLDIVGLCWHLIWIAPWIFVLSIGLITFGGLCG